MRMTDLDDLLQDLEDELGSRGSRKPQIRTTIEAAVNDRAQPRKVEKDSGANVDVDSLLEDLDTVSPIEKGLKGARIAEAPPASGAVDSSHLRKGKCFSIYIGGGRAPQGLGPNCACDRLRCSKCDFDVLKCCDQAWSSTCDYLFLRNFFPDKSKLKERLVASPGARCHSPFLVPHSAEPPSRWC